MLDIDYPNILETIKKHLVIKRTESASFLVWYLENYYRLDSLDAVDAVCDQRGDKGVDGIYVNENENTIDIFQTKISQDPNSTIGDTLLKEFYGTLSQFENKASLESLISSGGDADVVKLIKRHHLISKIEEFEIRGIFLSNINIDSNGEAYLKTKPEILFLGKSTLQHTFISANRTSAITGNMNFDISGFQIAKYFVDTNTKALIAPIKASELVNLNGISDQSLFAYNVRGPLGRTQVNKDIIASIKDATKHKMFPLFHNGITIISETLNDSKDKIEIENYYVVNGCQSLTSLYDNRTSMTDNLRILTKFIQVNVSSQLSEIITKYSNNQNGVKARDFKSNNQIQIRLQNEFNSFYGDQFFYEIKRGEPTNDRDVISNELAGLYLMAFDLKEPWGTHRKYQVFEDKYSSLFAKPEVSAHRILALHLLMNCIESHVDSINNKLFGKYALTRYMMLYMFRLIYEKDVDGLAFLANPKPFVNETRKRTHFKECVDTIIDDIIIDINAEIDPLGDDFDYRGKLRDAEWVKAFTKTIVSNYEKLVSRGRINSFSIDWRSSS